MAMDTDGLNNEKIRNLEIPTVDLSEVQEKTVVLRDQIDDFEVDKIIDDKKTSMFGSAFTRPKREEIHVHSKILAYESYIIMSGKYEIDFYRKATHSFDVEDDVDEIIIGDGIFPVKSDSAAWDKFGNKMKGGIGMKKKRLKC